MYSQSGRSIGHNLDLGNGIWSPRKETLEPPVCCQLVRSSGNRGGCDWRLKGDGQYCRTEALSCGTWCYLQVVSVRIELNCRISSWHGERVLLAADVVSLPQLRLRVWVWESKVVACHAALASVHWHSLSPDYFLPGNFHQLAYSISLFLLLSLSTPVNVWSMRASFVFFFFLPLPATQNLEWCPAHSVLRNPHCLYLVNTFITSHSVWEKVSDCSLTKWPSPTSGFVCNCFYDVI